MVDTTAHGEITVNMYNSSSGLNVRQEAINSGAIVGNNVLQTTPYALRPWENLQEQIWHPVHVKAEGETVQLQLTHTQEQMTNQNVVHSDFQLHAMIFYAQPVSRLQ